MTRACLCVAIFLWASVTQADEPLKVLVSVVRGVLDHETDPAERVALHAVLAKLGDADSLATLRRMQRTGRESEKPRRDADTEARVQRVAVFWLSELRDAESVRELVRRTYDLHDKEAIAALKKLGKAALPQLRAELLRPTRWQDKFALCRYLSDHVANIDECAPELAVLCRSEETRWLATRALENHAGMTERLASALIGHVLDADGPAEAANLLTALREVKPSRTVADADADTLISLFRQYPNETSGLLFGRAFAGPSARRDDAWRSLGRIAAQRRDVTNELAGRLELANVETRASARHVLGVERVPLQALDPQTLTELTDADARVRRQAVDRFAREPADALRTMTGEQRQRLLARLDDEVIDTRFTAVLVVGRLPADEAVPALRKSLGDDSAKVRYAAAFALARHGAAAKPAIAELTKATKDEDETVRNRAAETLRQLTDDQ